MRKLSHERPPSSLPFSPYEGPDDATTVGPLTKHSLSPFARHGRPLTVHVTVTQRVLPGFARLQESQLRLRLRMCRPQCTYCCNNSLCLARQNHRNLAAQRVQRIQYTVPQYCILLCLPASCLLRKPCRKAHVKPPGRAEWYGNCSTAEHSHGSWMQANRTAKKRGDPAAAQRPPGVDRTQ